MHIDFLDIDGYDRCARDMCGQRDCNHRICIGPTTMRRTRNRARGCRDDVGLDVK